MNTLSRVFILDLDDTLIDTQKVKNSFEENFYKIAGEDQDKIILWETYELVKAEKGFADYKYMANVLSEKLNIDDKKALDIFLLVSFKNCLIPKSLELIEYLQTLGKVIIFSQGEIQLQSQKISKTGIEESIGKDNIIIIEQKKEHVAKTIQDLKNQGFTNLTFIDDRAEILDQAYSIDKNIQCFWVRSGKYKDHFPQTSCVTFQSESLEEIYNFIYSNNTIEKIEDSEHEIIQIKIGIASNQIKQLITFTHQDKNIQNFTSDLKRFNNKESFKNWLLQGKYIYSLVDSRDNLIGLIWFNEKSPPEAEYLQNIDHYKITLGIRIYGNARGKGLGKKLFSIALRHFKATSEYKSIINNGFWSVISHDNIASQKLHENIGFKTVTKPDAEGKIVMIYK